MVHDGSEREPLGTYLVERYLPGITGGALERLCNRVRARAAAMRAEGTAVAHISTTLLPDEEAVFCLFEAPTADVVAEVNRGARAPFDRITAAVPVALGPTSRSDVHDESVTDVPRRKVVVQ
jgi:hypothetical protein